MTLDGTTLLVINLCIAIFATIIWILSAFLFKTETLTSINFALANFILGMFMLLYVINDYLPINFAFAVADIMAVLGTLLLKRATEEFVNINKQDKILATLSLFVIVSSIYLRFYNFITISLIMVSLICLYGLTGAWINSYNYMIKSFRKTYCIVTTLPLFLIAVLLFIRIATIILVPDTVIELTEKSTFNTLFLIIMIFSTLGFNSTAIGLVISKMINQIKLLSQEDPLTKIFNRRHLNTIAEKEIGISNIEHNNLSLIELDIDHFKNVNDIYGHAAGDAVLVFCVKVIKESIRSTDYVGRLGGEEFCVLLPNTNLDEAKKLAERIRANIESQYIIYEGKKISITASFGVTTVDINSKNEWTKLLSKADIAMYQAKNNGRNQVAIG